MMDNKYCVWIPHPCEDCSARDSYCYFNCPIKESYNKTMKLFIEKGLANEIGWMTEEAADEFIRIVYTME